MRTDRRRRNQNAGTARSRACRSGSMADRLGDARGSSLIKSPSADGASGAGVGAFIKLDLGAQAFQFKAGPCSIGRFWRSFAGSLVATRLIERSRFGAWLIAVRENEDAAKALGVDARSVKTAAMVISGAITAAAGCFYAQYFLLVDSGIAYGAWISIEALLHADHRRRRYRVRAAARRAGG